MESSTTYWDGETESEDAVKGLGVESVGDSNESDLIVFSCY